ncbi:MAG: tRNA pseudouridine(55) synthase TruB [Hydrogenothermaceae bacterium]|nr:tRNA pseudouridine(55) synthase TruB [Hydrogenothermaceae bacterium]
MDGILLVNKPKFITSNDLVQKIKKYTGEKVGHTGTLDYVAQGLMVLTFGKATRFTQFLQKLDKEYIATGKLGEITDTYDSQGKVIQENPVNISKENLKEIILSFVGEYYQFPPPYSAKKIGGKRAYQLAKKGIDPQLKPVKVSIYNIEILNIDIPYFIIKVSCSSGTYIRSLIKDIGDKTGSGAYMTELTRTKVGQFKVEDSLTLDELLNMKKEDIEKRLISIKEALYFMESLVLRNEYVRRFKHGQKIEVNIKDLDTIKVLDESENLVGLGKVENRVLKPIIVVQ